MVAFRRQFDRIWTRLFGTWLFGAPAIPPIAAEPTDWCRSKHFTPGTKVYCLPAQWGDGYEKAVVVGICRGSRRWITVAMSTDLITNWRAKVVYKPAVLHRLREGFDGFNRQWTSQKEVEEFAAFMRQHGG